jgi:hypothetical protein
MDGQEDQRFVSLDLDCQKVGETLSAISVPSGLRKNSTSMRGWRLRRRSGARNEAISAALRVPGRLSTADTSPPVHMVRQLEATARQQCVF